MSSIHSRNTKPELVVRSILSKLGFRYRLYGRLLPGNPDIFFSGRKIAIFVNGCYWHMHNCKYGKVVPKTNHTFWMKKRLSNKKRDKINYEKLKKNNWKKIIIWECEIKKNPDKVVDKIVKFLKQKNDKGGKDKDEKRIRKIDKTTLL